jgi:ATP-dependent DNA helicase RecG
MDLINIKGIGLKSLEYLKKLEIFSIKDLINYYPFRYEVLKRSDLNNNEEKVIVDGVVESIPYLYRIKSNMNKMQFTMNINNNIYKIIIFNRGFLKNNIYVGKIITVIGKLDKKKNVITANNIILKPLKDEPEIIPVYKTTNSLSKQLLSNYIKQGLSKIDIIDDLPKYIVDKNNLLSKKEAVFNIHNPNNIDILKKSLLRLKYEELLMFMLKITYLKLKNENNNGINKNIDLSLLNDIKKLLSFELTTDQN